MVTFGKRNANAVVRLMTYSVNDLYGRSLSQIYWGDRVNKDNHLILCYCPECLIQVSNHRDRLRIGAIRRRDIPSSSNGRTPGSGPGNRGSSPCEGAIPLSHRQSMRKILRGMR